jgi:hypothetical protein
MAEYLLSEGASNQFDEIARRVLGLMEGGQMARSFANTQSRDIFVKVSAIYTPEGGYSDKMQLQLKARQVHYNEAGVKEDGRLNFDPDDTSSEYGSGGVGYTNTGLPIYVPEADFDRNKPSAQSETYVGKTFRASLSSMKNHVTNKWEPMWVLKVGGLGQALGPQIYDVRIKSAEGPDRYRVDAYTNYYGRQYSDPDGGSTDPTISDATMLIPNATGNELPASAEGFAMKCVGYIEYHDTPIGSPPEPPDPLPPNYTPPPPPWETVVLRPINLWRYL